MSGFPTCLANHQRNKLLQSFTHTGESQAALYLCRGTSAWAANTAKNSTAYFGTFSQPNRKAEGGNDCYLRKDTHGTEVIFNLRRPKGALSNCCSLLSISWVFLLSDGTHRLSLARFPQENKRAAQTRSHRWDLLKQVGKTVLIF